MADKNFKVKNALELGTGTITVGANTVTLPSATDTLVGKATTDTFTNKTLQSPQELLTIAAVATGTTVNFDTVTQSVLYNTTAASANWSMNIRGNSTTTLNSLLALNNSITITFMATQGATAYYQTAMTIDSGTSSSVTITPKWQGGVAPSAGNASGIDAYSFSIIKTASGTPPTYVVLASQTGFA